MSDGFGCAVILFLLIIAFVSAGIGFNMGVEKGKTDTINLPAEEVKIPEIPNQKIKWLGKPVRLTDFFYHDLSIGTFQVGSLTWLVIDSSEGTKFINLEKEHAEN
jgi:hypothetical protein